MDLATTPEHPNLHPLEVQRGTKLRLHMERIAPTSIAPIDITRAVDIAHEILAGLFETYDPAAYADAFARCRSVPLVVMCVRTFFEVERLLAERHAAEVAQAAARERAEEEEAERERAQAEARADAWARERAGMPEVVIPELLIVPRADGVSGAPRLGALGVSIPPRFAQPQPQLQPAPPPRPIQVVSLPVP